MTNPIPYIIPQLPLQDFVESPALLKKSIKAHQALAKLNGIVKIIPNQNILINWLTLQEAKDSSEIENIITTHDELYKSEISDSSTTPAIKEVQGYREWLIYGYDIVQQQWILINKDIIQIQSMLEKNDAWFRNQPGTKLENEQTKEVIYEPPQSHSDIQNFMSNFEKYLNTDDDTDRLIKLAILHHQFESIHPFFDGNWRTWRIINILYLCMNWLLDLPILYLSWYILQTKQDYYRLIQNVRDTWDWSSRIEYILHWVYVTSNATILLVTEIDSLMKETKHILRSETDFYTKDLLEIIFQHPYSKITFLTEGLWVVRQTASKYLHTLCDLWICEELKIGQSKYFINKKLYETFRKWLVF